MEINREVKQIIFKSESAADVLLKVFNSMFLCVSSICLYIQIFGLEQSA